MFTGSDVSKPVGYVVKSNYIVGFVIQSEMVQPNDFIESQRAHIKKEYGSN